MAQITTTHKGDMLFATQMGSHTIQIDVPASMGGDDRGPTPPELFVASLGSCIGAFVASYCRDHGIDATDMTVDITFDKAQNPTRLVNLKAIVNMPNATCHNREAAIKRVAEHCPVHETIATMSDIEFVIRDREVIEKEMA